MKIKAGVNFHNRFDIVKNGEWVGYAENIILDQMYNSICNFSTYFVNVHFGTGSGIPTPDRTSLFSHLGTKTAVMEEIIKAFPTSKVTKKIVINPDEYVEETITEVGVAYGSNVNYLVTHAMIKDAEGNLLSIDKTDIDVIEIYSTVFVTFNDTSGSFYFSRVQSNNLVDYFVNHGNASTSIVADLSDYVDVGSRGDIVNGVGIKSPYVDVDVQAKTRTYSTRVGVEEVNSKQIKAVVLQNICRAVLKPSGLITDVTLTNVTLGVGDDENTEFEIPHVQPKNIVVKVDGVTVSNYSVEHNSEEDNPTFKTVQEYFDDEITPPSIYFWDGFNGFASARTKLTTSAGVFKSQKSLEGLYLINEIAATSSTTSSVRLDASVDGVNFTTILSSSSAYARLITHPGPYYNVYLTYNTTVGSAYNIKIGDLDNTAMPKVTFATPPSQDALITADYTVEYLPKDENYVLDVAFELQFGEGV